MQAGGATGNYLVPRSLYAFREPVPGSGIEGVIDRSVRWLLSESQLSVSAEIAGAPTPLVGYELRGLTVSDRRASIIPILEQSTNQDVPQQ